MENQIETSPITKARVYEVINMLTSLTNLNEKVNGKTMLFILEELGMTDEMLRQLIMNNPESDTHDLLMEKTILSDLKIHNKTELGEREKFLQALTNFNFAWGELSRLWETYWKNNDLADYPFEESFDELALRVSEWVDESKDLVYAKDITDQKIVKRNFISTLEIMRDEKSCGFNFAIGGDIIPLCYWNSDEWEEDPETVVPAMTNAIELFYTDKELLVTTLGYKIID